MNACLKRIIIGWAVVSALLCVAPVLARQGQDIERRITSLEGARPSERLAVIESKQEENTRRLDSIERIGTGILIVVVAQLLLSGVEWKLRRKGG